MRVVVTLPYNPTWPALEWAKKNCPSYITNDAYRYLNSDGVELAEIDKINYYFSNEKDALMFRLRWTE